MPSPEMQVFDTPAGMRSWSLGRRAAGSRIVLVPTMGALHEGHLALIHEAHRRGDAVVVSIFVNPLQFNRSDDFDAYPRPIEADLAACSAAGVHAVYAPRASTMYPPHFQTHIEPGALAEPLEGSGRPGHFRGVVTVVNKLFGAVQPQIAVFGQKDFQQLAVVRQMVSDLDMGIEIIGLPTVREPDGLAMSSRNRRLTTTQRAAATCIARALQVAADMFERGERSAPAIAAGAAGCVQAEPEARLEYLQLVDSDTLQPLEHLEYVEREPLVVVAVWFGDVRLIDNRLLTGTRSA